MVNTIIKICYFFLVIFFSTQLFSQKQDTTKIVFFVDSNIQQFKGPEWHRALKSIPNGKYKKAILKIELGCATYGCCAWDYTYRGFFSKKINDTTYDDHEVARLITPYSSFMRKGRNGYDSTWVHPYIYDVTDYLPIINESLIYSAHTGGWDNKGNFGFKHTVTLILISGESDQTRSRVVPVYKNDYRYHDSTQFDKLMEPIIFKLNPDEKSAKFRMIFTGHDQQGEFSPIPFYLRVNGKNIYHKRLWKSDCDKNQIQPQSGTWIFSRCNWCPGEKVHEIEVDLSSHLTLTENEVEIALGRIETNDSIVKANYLINADIITYKNDIQSDIELLEIVSPSDKSHNKIYNPICQNPKLRVKNHGNKIAKYVRIKYWMDNNHPSNFFWTGEIQPFEEKIIEASLFDMSGINKNSIFYAELKKNEFNLDPSNDKLSSNLIQTDVFYTSSIIIYLSTSNDSSINNLEMTKVGQPLSYFKKQYLNNQNIYRDTIVIGEGCYKIELKDFDKDYECGDGLSFWFSSMVGKKASGVFKILDGNTGKILKVFNPDFGGKIEYQFRIDNSSKRSKTSTRKLSTYTIEE